MVGAHEGRIDGKFRERRLAWKKGSWPRHIPVPLSNVSAPVVFTSVYLKLITYYYAHILLIAMLFWSYYTRFKTNKAKICIHMDLLRPHFCLLHKIFDVTILAKPFVFHKTRWNFVLAANLPRDVWSNAIIWRNQNKNALTPCVWLEVSGVHIFWSASTQRKHSVFARRFQRVRSEKNIIEGALMTKRP